MIRAFLGLFLALTLGISAHAWPRHGAGTAPPPGACTKGTAFADACNGLAQLGHIGTTADYASYAAYVSSVQLSNQTWAGGAQTAQIEGWNMPGVAPFAIGPWTPRASMANPWDAITAGTLHFCIHAFQSDGISPQIRCITAGTAVDVEGYDFRPLSGTYGGSAVTLGSTITGCPTTCVLNVGSVSSGAINLGQFLSGGTLTFPCGITTTSSPSSPYTLAGGGCSNQSSEEIDLKGACILLHPQNNLASLTIKNSHFQQSQTCSNSSAGNNTGTVLDISASSSTYPVDVESVEFDGNCAEISATAFNSDVEDGRVGATSGSGIWAANRFHDACFRPFNGDDGASIWISNNWLRYCLLCTVAGTHGEAFEYGPVGATCTGSAPVVCTNEVIAPVTQTVLGNTYTGSLIAKFNLNVPAQIASAGMTTPFYIGDGGRKGTDYVNVQVDYNTAITNQFTVAASPGGVTGYNSSTGVVTLATNPTLALFSGANVTISGATGTGANVSSLNGTFSLTAASASNCVSSCFISYTIASGLSITSITAAQINGNEIGTTLLASTGTQFDQFEVIGNVVDISGGLNLNLAGTYVCITWGLGNQGITGSTDGSTAQLAVTNRGTATIVPGAILLGGTLTASPPLVLAYGPLSTDGNGGTGTYYLDRTPTAGSSNAYTAIGYFPSGMNVPGSGGVNVENWSLTSNTAITGYARGDNVGSPVCH